MASQELQPSDYRIRKLIGSLGLSLPIILPISEGEFLSSISHYYYHTFSSLLFIIILSTFALFLISYKGYKFDRTTETISDDLITNIGGFAALIVVFVPTYCFESQSDVIERLCQTQSYPLFGHANRTLNTLHLVSAGVFMFSMGWMSRYKFTRSDDEGKNKIHRLCGTIVWGAIAALILLVLADLIKDGFRITQYDVYILETIAIVPFGVSWLIKGEAIEYIKAMFG